MTKLYLLIVTVFCTLLLVQSIHYFQFTEQMAKFAQKGPRFTAQNGQDLCERVKKFDGLPCYYYPGK